MKVEISPDDTKTYVADDRGRITLGAAYKNRHVEIAILDDGSGQQEDS